MTTIPLAAPRAATTPRVNPIYYLRAVVALAMIGAWAVAAASGVVLWAVPVARGIGELTPTLGMVRHTWIDAHVVASFLAVLLTLTHLTVMRRGVLAYARLLLTGQRRATGAARRPKRVVFVRAAVVVTMVVVVPLVATSGIIPWLAADGRRSGQQLLLFAMTKRSWADVHTLVSMLALGLAATHILVVKSGLVSDVRLLVTGRRGAPRRAQPDRPRAA